MPLPYAWISILANRYSGLFSNRPASQWATLG
jgi:hypothetical protein